MKRIHRLLPAREEVELHQFLVELDTAPLRRPFDAETITFCGDISKRLLADRHARRFPALQALGFWIRRAALEQLRDAWRLTQTTNAIAVPQGTVFHVPPSNIDTMFVYSWVLALLMGNRNIVRVPSRDTEQVVILSRIIGDAFQAAPGEFSSSNAMLRYGHEDDVTSALSAACDVRVIWGGDASVDHIRSIRIPARATDVTFPDRFSLAALRAGAVLALAPSDLDALAVRFFNDAYWFDQMGCSSPRLVVWCGEDEATSRAAEVFFAAVETVVAARGYQNDIGTAVAKQSYLHGAVLELPVSRVRRTTNEVVVLTLEQPVLNRDYLFGAGCFLEMRLRQLDELIPHLSRRDQTLAVFGFPESELEAFVCRANGRGIDRIVPIGDALAFHHIWDGKDLLRCFSRLVTAPVSS